MPAPVPLYRALGGAAGCRALATAFYAQVARDPILRPLFPSTFTCAIAEFSAFLVQLLGGEPEAMQRRWWLSLEASHARFAIGPRERAAWLRAMSATLEDDSTVADAAVRAELLEFFRSASAHVVNRGPAPAAEPIGGPLAPLWEEQLALDRVVELAASPASGAACVELLESPVMQARFARSPSTHASVLSLAASAPARVLREYALARLRAHPGLVQERYRHGRTLLHDAAAAGNLPLVELLLELGAGRTPDPEGERSPLYCVANESSGHAAGPIVRALLKRSAVQIDAPIGAKRCTALHMAARRGNCDAIAALLDGGANLEARDSAGDTPLRRAVNCDKVEAARLLLARGADPRSVGSRALTPVRAARSSRMKALFA